MESILDERERQWMDTEGEEEEEEEEEERRSHVVTKDKNRIFNHVSYPMLVGRSVSSYIRMTQTDDTSDCNNTFFSSKTTLVSNYTHVVRTVFKPSLLYFSHD